MLATTDFQRQDGFSVDTVWLYMMEVIQVNTEGEIYKQGQLNW